MEDYFFCVQHRERGCMLPGDGAAPDRPPGEQASARHCPESMHGGCRPSSDLSSPTPQLWEPRDGLHFSEPHCSPPGKGDRALPHGLLEKSRLSLV